jgi:hypothetical protein
MRLERNITLTLAFLAALAWIGAEQALASVTLTGASGGTSLSADTAANASMPAWTTLGPITIAEGQKKDFTAGTGVTLILKAPEGFEFNLAAPPNIAFTTGADITSANVTLTDASTLTITLTVSGTGSTDTLRLGNSTGLQVRPVAGTPLATGKHIYRPSSGGGTATISGITTSADGSSGSNFGNLTEVVGASARVRVETTANGTGAIVPAQDVAAGSSITAYAIARDVFSNFVANVAADVGGWSLVNTSGGVVSADLVPAGDRKSAVFTGHLVGSASIHAVSGALGPTDSGPIRVVPGAANKLVIAIQPSPTAVVGVPLATQPVIWIEDQIGNLRSNDTLTVTASRNGGTGTLQGTASLAAVGGVATFTNLAHLAVGDLTIAFSSGSLTPATSQTISVGSGPFSQFQVLLPGETATPGVAPGKSGTPTARTVGIPFNVQVAAVDAGWNLINTVTDMVAITSSDGAAILPANAALINGARSFAVTLKSPGSQTVTASDVTTGSQSGTSSPVMVYTFSKLQLLVPGETAAPGTSSGKAGAPSNQTAGVSYSVTVNAVDANWNVVNTNDTVAITSSDANATLPASAALVNGTRTFSVANKTGTWTMTASDSTHPGITASTSPPIRVTGGFTTNTFGFAYANRTALLADGWSFWATNNGAGRNTEITDTNVGAVVKYRPADNPGALRIPVDAGTLLQTANNSRNSLFRPLATNWVSIRLALSYTPTNNWQDAHLDVYQDDDNYVTVHHRFSGDERVGMAREGTGMLLSYHAVNVIRLSATNMTLRLDRDPVTDRISGLYSLDGSNWVTIGSFSQAYTNARVGIVAGDSSGGLPNCDLVRLEVVTQEAPVSPAIILQPQHLVFNSFAGHSCTNVQALNAVLQCRQNAPVHWSLGNSAPGWLKTSVTAGDTPAACDVSVDTTGLAAGSYQGTLLFTAPGATSAVAQVTLIVNPNSRVSLANWQGGKKGAMSASVDDSWPTAFDELSTNGLRGSYVMWQDTAPPFYPTYYAAGMELGCHTLSHSCIVIPAATIRGEIEGNIAGLVATTPEPQAQVIFFVWPCGAPNSIDEQIVPADYFLAARDFNVNLLEDPSPYNFMRLKSFNSHQANAQLVNPSAPPNPPDFRPVVDAAIAQGKWFVMVLHDVNNDDGAIAYSVGKDIWVAPVGSVVKYILQRDRTVITNYTETGTYIQFGCYRLPLDPSAVRSFETAIGTRDFMTVAVDTTGLAQVSALFVNGIETPFTNHGGALYFNTLITTNTQNIYLDLQPNTAPVLGAQLDRTMNELTTLVVTNPATDADVPAQILTYRLFVNNVNDGMQQTNALIDANGVITWTPTEVQGPGTYLFTTVATDYATPPLSATNTFRVTVNEINVSPVLPSLPNLTVYGPVPLTLTNTATDADWPPNALTYSLPSAPMGATIDANGVIRWTPPDAQNPSTNVFTTAVTDSSPKASNAQSLSVTNTFTVTVIANPLQLPNQANRTISQQTTLMVNNAATVSTNLISSGWLATNATAFNYSSREALLADGWSFWATNSGVGRNTEVTDTNIGVISYSQTNATLGVVMRVPCGLGDLWSAFSNTTTNSIFRDIPANWASLRLKLGFQPTGDYEQAHLVLYQDDDNYLEVGLDYSSGERVLFVQEILGLPSVVASAGTTAGVISLRLDRDSSGSVSALFSLDDANWTLLGQVAQALPNVRAGIWVGASTLPYGSTHVVCDLSRLDLVVLNTLEPITYLLTVTNTLDSSNVTNAAIDANGLITWTPTVAQAPGVYTFTTAAVDNRVPTLYATNSFTVTVVPTTTLSIRSVVPSDGTNVVITWTSVSNSVYQVQHKTNLASANWTDLSPTVTATGSTASYTDHPADARPRFYRVALLP